MSLVIASPAASGPRPRLSRSSIDPSRLGARASERDVSRSSPILAGLSLDTVIPSVVIFPDARVSTDRPLLLQGLLTARLLPGCQGGAYAACQRGVAWEARSIDAVAMILLGVSRVAIHREMAVEGKERGDRAGLASCIIRYRPVTQWAVWENCVVVPWLRSRVTTGSTLTTMADWGLPCSE